MNDEFIKQTTDYIKQFVSDEYEVMNSTTQKNNGVVLHGVSIKNKNERLSPVFYLDGYEGMEPEVAAQQIIERYREVKQREIPFDVDTITDFSKVKEMICYKLVNLEANKDMLMDMPYDEVAGDIGLIYYLDLGNDATITIKEGMLDLWGITADELYDYAQVNTQARYPATLRSMAETMVDIMAGGNLQEMKMHFNMFDLSDDEFRKAMAKELDKDNPVKMYVLQGGKVFGASALMYDEVMANVFNEIGGDYYILPSSIHELLVIRADGEISVPELKAMVEEVNRTEVSETERLSDNVFFCNGKEVIVVDDTFIPQRNTGNHDER